MTESRSLRRRHARRRSPAAEPVPTSVKVMVQMTDFATRITQSFLIMPGSTVAANLTGYIETTDGLPRAIVVPLSIRADIY